MGLAKPWFQSSCVTRTLHRVQMPAYKQWGAKVLDHDANDVILQLHYVFSTHFLNVKKGNLIVIFIRYNEQDSNYMYNVRQVLNLGPTTIYIGSCHLFFFRKNIRLQKQVRINTRNNNRFQFSNALSSKQYIFDTNCCL